ncbi:MAG: ACP S-malonyltransferase [Verrucomicrobiota bacterium]|nr:ACP S-malonyltransferase [Verrucomicrobiota bacterium]
MKRVALLFPGQGAQYVGMGKDFWEAFSIARETFQEADDILGEFLSKTIFEGPETELTKTRCAQTAIFVVSAALYRTLQQQMPEMQPTVCAGLSLGEYTALWASKRLSFRETLLLIQKRAELMNEACEQVRGTMAAVLGTVDFETALKGISGVWVANYNCPGQTVISGTEEGVQAATVALKEAGAKRVIPLQVHGAFHSGLMQSAQDALLPFLAAAPLIDSSIGLAMNAPGTIVTDLPTIRSNLQRQVTHSVRWEQGIRAMEAQGIDQYIEIGCGKTLTGFNKKIGVLAPSLSIEKTGDLETVCNC